MGINEIENTILCGSAKIDNKTLLQMDILQPLYNYKKPGVFDANLEIIKEMVAFHTEASFVSAVINQFEYYRNNNIEIKDINDLQIQKIGSFVNKLNKYDYQVVFIRNFIRSEMIRYHLFEEYYYGYMEDKGISELKNILILTMDKFNYISDKCKYPIRNRIQHIISGVMDTINDDENKIKKLVVFKSEAYREAVRISMQYDSYIKKGKNKYELIQKYMMEILDIFRVYMPGSDGHLLWLYCYIGDLLYYQMSYYDKETDSESINGYFGEKIRGTEYEFNVTDLDKMFNEFVMLSENWVSRNFYSGKLDEMAFYLLTPKSFEMKRQYKRIKKVLKRNKSVRANFYSITRNNEFGGSGKGKGNGSSCFAILTNGSDHRVAISGFDKTVNVKGANQVLVNYCNHILKIKGTKGVIKPIDPIEYTESLYIWASPLRKDDRIEYGDALYKSIYNNKIYYDKIHGRMFSCAERRLIHRYKPGYFIISKKQPCYMCQRVLNNKNITSYTYYENYNGNLDENYYDSIATIIKSLEP